MLVDLYMELDDSVYYFKVLNRKGVGSQVLIFVQLKELIKFFLVVFFELQKYKDFFCNRAESLFGQSGKLVKCMLVLKGKKK